MLPDSPPGGVKWLDALHGIQSGRAKSGHGGPHARRRVRETEKPVGGWIGNRDRAGSYSAAYTSVGTADRHT